MTYASLLASAVLAQEGSAAPTAPAATGTAATGTGTAPAQQGGGIMTFALPIVLIGGMVVMMIMSSRKQKKEKAALNARLQKGAKVTTIGGARGKVVELTDTEVTVQFEDSRITFLRSAVQSVDEVPA